MDASCKIQRSIHDVRLTYKYVSRILGTYHLETVSFFELKSGNIFLCEVDHKLFRHGIGQTSAEKLTFDHIDGSNCIDADDIFCCCVAR